MPSYWRSSPLGKTGQQMLVAALEGTTDMLDSNHVDAAAAVDHVVELSSQALETNSGVWFCLLHLKHLDNPPALAPRPDLLRSNSQRTQFSFALLMYDLEATPRCNHDVFRSINGDYLKFQFLCIFGWPNSVR